MPNPSWWIVYIEGVGAMYECPKKFLILFLFQFASAVRRIPIELGDDVARRNMVAACFLFCWKVYSIVCSDPCKKVEVIGHNPLQPNYLSLSLSSSEIIDSTIERERTEKLKVSVELRNCILCQPNFFS
jgi:hypothetical protein